MKLMDYPHSFSAALLGCALSLPSLATETVTTYSYSMTPTEADKRWLLAAPPKDPVDNALTETRVELGKMLFFDPRVSGDGNMSCATCHNPMFGWSDGFETAKGSKSKVLNRATPTIINSGYNTIHMWDGRKKSLEDQATGPLENPDEMGSDLQAFFAFLNKNEGYKALFAKAYPNEPIDGNTFAKAISAFERTIVSNNSRFDQWLKGDANALTQQEILGFRLFEDPNKGNCAACHQPPNFTDNGFHNLGLSSYDDETPDMGRFNIKKVSALKGAFKTPTLRDIESTTPYFHDGSAKNLDEVMAHYIKGGAGAKDVSPNLKPLVLTEPEVAAIVAFMKSLSSPATPIVLPNLPK